MKFSTSCFYFKDTVEYFASVKRHFEKNGKFADFHSYGKLNDRARVDNLELGWNLAKSGKRI